VLGLYTLSCVGASVCREGLALPIGPNWDFTEDGIASPKHFVLDKKKEDE
jgi:hypothetical protein